MSNETNIPNITINALNETSSLSETDSFIVQPAETKTAKVSYRTLFNVFYSKLTKLIYPVGSIYMSVKNTSPSDLFGGTWEIWGSGRVPVGVDSGQTEFSTVENPGGI